MTSRYSTVIQSAQRIRSHFRHGRFVRNVVLVVMGTAGAQAISIVAAPLITRIYGPEVFGVFGVFVSIVTLLAPIVAMTYPIAMVLPERDIDARDIGFLSVGISGIVAVIALTVIVVGHRFSPLASSGTLLGGLIYLLVPVTVLTALVQVGSNWLIRSRRFSVIARLTVIHALIANIAKVFVGLIAATSAALVGVYVAGVAIHALLFALAVARVGQFPKGEGVSCARIVEIARKNRDFPFYRAPQAIANAASQALPVLMLTAFFGAAPAGYYVLARTVMGMPASLIAKSVGDVFYPRAAALANTGQDLRGELIKATAALAVVGAVPFAIIGIGGPILFALFFGEAWVTAGDYAQWLSVWFFFGFINRPSVAAIPVLGLQRAFFIYEIVGLLARAASIVIAMLNDQSDSVAIAYFAVVGTVLNSVLVVFTILRASKARPAAGAAHPDRSNR